MNCIVHNCTNVSSDFFGKNIWIDGKEDVWICTPCYDFLITGVICQGSSQLARNGCVEKQTVLSDKIHKKTKQLRDLKEKINENEIVIKETNSNFGFKSLVLDLLLELFWLGCMRFSKADMVWIKFEENIKKIQEWKEGK